jgi:hypothetical protein
VKILDNILRKLKMLDGKTVHVTIKKTVEQERDTLRKIANG